MRKVLVVDDDQGVRLVLSRSLEVMGFSVTIAASGTEALKVLDEAAFDAVLMDINMPPITGIETCARIMAGGSSSSPPVWLMTGMWCPDVERRGIAAGARAVLAKPFNCADLVKQMEYSGLSAV